MTNIPSKQINTTRRPDCVTKVRRGNTVLTVFGYFKRDGTPLTTKRRKFGGREPLVVLLRQDLA